jgi:hypothetical protein
MTSLRVRTARFALSCGIVSCIACTDSGKNGRHQSEEPAHGSDGGQNQDADVRADASSPQATHDAGKARDAGHDAALSVDAGQREPDAGARCARERGPIVAGKLALRSGAQSMDAAYEKAVGVLNSDVQTDQASGKAHFIAGESWSQVWTRDTSYSIDLGAGLLFADVAKSTLQGMTQNVSGIGDVWIQDAAGHFGGWPNLSDSIVGAQGAWSLYLTTGDREFLAWSYTITLNTLARAERDVFIAADGLFGGCSTFMESNSGYPGKYANTKTLLAKTKALSTNLLYYRGYFVAAEMGKVLGKDVAALETKAAQLKDAINQRLWLPDQGFYAYFEDENGAQEKKMEGTGEAFAILWGVADQERSASILAHTPTTAWGLPCLWPQYSEWLNYNTGDANYYHNGMIWPFVQGYWGWAAAQAGAQTHFASELDHMRVLSEKNDTFQEFYRPEDGAPDGSRRQLWSASGYLSMVYHGLFGMGFDVDGVSFAPVVPDVFTALTLDGVPYRQATLNLSVSGHGTHVTRFAIDGVTQPEARIGRDLSGTHRIDIAMDECD